MNEQANQNATHGSLPKRNSVNVPVAASVNLNTPQDNTSGRIPGDDPAALHGVPDAATCKATVNDEAAASDHKDTTSSGPMRRLSRQFSRDSQKSGESADGESGKRKRSSSISSFSTEMLKGRRSSKKDELLVTNEEQHTNV